MLVFRLVSRPPQGGDAFGRCRLYTSMFRSWSHTVNHTSGFYRTYVHRALSELRTSFAQSRLEQGRDTRLTWFDGTCFMFMLVRAWAQTPCKGLYEAMNLDYNKQTAE